MHRIYLAGLLSLSGCQSYSGPYQRIGPGPELAYAEAQCNILALSTEQSVVAWGSPSYVAGAQLGNAIGNAMRAEEFKRNCMIMQGWARTPSITAQERAQLAKNRAAGIKAVEDAEAQGQQFPAAPN